MNHTITLLFYPELPPENAAIIQLCAHLKYQVSNNPSDHFDVAFKCFDATFFSPILLEALDVIEHDVINRKCIDLSRRHIAEKFTNSFAETLTINPATYHGKIIKRANIVGLDPAAILSAPLSLNSIDHDFIYQRFIENVMPCYAVICGDRLPIIIHKAIDKPETRLNPTQIQKLLTFAQSIGLDYGLLEIIQHPQTQQIYMINVEDTGWTFPPDLTEQQKQDYLEKMSPAFIALTVNHL